MLIDGAMHDQHAQQHRPRVLRHAGIFQDRDDGRLLRCRTLAAVIEGAG
jgi:hypothetical protein